MLINLRNALMSGKRMPTAKDYVQGGLVAMWDGIENAGWGQHNASAESWVDLIGGVEMPALSFGDNYATVSSSVSITAQSILNALGGQSLTIEMLTVFGAAETSNTIDNIAVEPSRSYLLFRNYTYGTNVSTATGFRYLYGTQNKFYSIPKTTDNVWTLKMSVVKSSSDVDVWYDSTSGRTSVSYSATTPTSQPTSLNLKRSGSPKLYALRIYNRALAADEIARNYNIDKARFNLP